MREWLRRTHGPGFELLRHFLLRFFDSDLVTTPGAMTAALMLVATAAIFTINLLPSFGFPAVSASRWQFGPSMAPRILAHAVASTAACYFFLFALVALQGLLLNLLRPRWFGRVSGYAQGFLVAGMLTLVVLSFSIDPAIADGALTPEFARWLPPVWFLGLYHTMSGDPDPAMLMLDHRALAALAIAVALALATYLVSYRRHRELLIEGAAGPSRDRRWSGAILRRLLPNPRQQAVFAFMAKTLARSSDHRMILMGYGGFGVAILMSGIVGVRSAVPAYKATAASFIYCHAVVLAFLLIALRHLF